MSDIGHSNYITEPEPPYDPSCVECRQAAGKDAAGTSWKCIGHVYLERDRLRAALATAQAERAEALMECNCAVLERDAALRRAKDAEDERAEDVAVYRSRAEQAEAALAQAQKEAATCRHNYAVLCETGQRNDAAQSPALPPLPEGWVREGVRDIILYRSHDRYTGVDGHVPPGGQVSVHAEGLRVSTTHVPVADLLIVLRHAEAAHLTLKEGK